eukprot:1151232-Pleurochrysis_carterae.AAC.1
MQAGRGRRDGRGQLGRRARKRADRASVSGQEECVQAGWDSFYSWGRAAQMAHICFQHARSTHAAFSAPVLPFFAHWQCPCSISSLSLCTNHCA